jgi:hypothetical protein
MAWFTPAHDLCKRRRKESEREKLRQVLAVMGPEFNNWEVVFRKFGKTAPKKRRRGRPCRLAGRQGLSSVPPIQERYEILGNERHAVVSTGNRLHHIQHHSVKSVVHLLVRLSSSIRNGC